MSARGTTVERLGAGAAAAVAGIGVAYVLVLGIGFARHGLHEPIRDPVLAWMEWLTLGSAAALVLLFAAVHEYASPERRVLALGALGFAALCAGTTGVVHFTELTAVDRGASTAFVWPSRTYAAELLAWDVFLGLALVLAAPVLEGSRARAARLALGLAGALCLIGTVGPVTGDLRLQRAGILGYAVVLPVAAALLARHFARGSRGPAAER